MKIARLIDKDTSFVQSIIHVHEINTRVRGYLYYANIDWDDTLKNEQELDLQHIEPIAEFDVKWDGCQNWDFYPNIHLCGPFLTTIFLKQIVFTLLVAEKLLENYDEDNKHLPIGILRNYTIAIGNVECKSLEEYFKEVEE